MNTDLSINEIKAMKEQLENRIHDELQTFTLATGMIIADLQFVSNHINDDISDGPGYQKISSVHIDVLL